MTGLITKLTQKIDGWKQEVQQLVKTSGNIKVSDVTVSQLYGGMRGIKSLSCDTSVVPDDQGLIIRNYFLKDLTEYLPEEIFYLLLTGELPTPTELTEFQTELKSRKNVPNYVWDVLKAMPSDSHPMAMLSAALLSMQKESVFAKSYEKGCKKDEYWKHTLDDSMNIVAKLPGISAAIYRLRFNKGELIQPDPDMDFTSDFLYMMGLDHKNTEIYNLFRLYLVCHCDHEGGNVSSLTSATVNSALSDLYYSMSAGFNGLAGPLHGRANQECIDWIIKLNQKYNGVPTKEDLIQFVTETLKAGKVIPGYGHAILRIVDPRFEAFMKYGNKYCADEPIFQSVKLVFETVPDILKTIEKIKDPWPNIDAISGALLYHYGVREFLYYTNIFALSRALGFASQAVMNRGMMLPLIRPKSVTTEFVKNLVANNS